MFETESEKEDRNNRRKAYESVRDEFETLLYEVRKKEDFLEELELEDEIDIQALQ